MQNAADHAAATTYGSPDMTPRIPDDPHDWLSLLDVAAPPRVPNDNNDEDGENDDDDEDDEDDEDEEEEDDEPPVIREPEEGE